MLRFIPVKTQNIRKRTFQMIWRETRREVLCGGGGDR